MTTPAVFIDNTVTDPAKKLTSYSNGNVTETTIQQTIVNRFRLSRPKSVNNPLYRGWRRPWSYYRTQGRQDTTTATVVQEYNGLVTPPSVLPVREDWLRDSFWSRNSFPLQYGSPPSNMEDKALIAALNKLKGDNVNFGVALAEAGQVAKLLSSTTRTIAKEVNTFKRNKRAWADVRRYQRGGSHDWRKIPSKWLELQYGWNPLMSDIAQASTSLEETWNSNYPLLGVQATSYASDVIRRTGTGQYGSSRVERTDFMYLYKVCLYYQLITPWLAQFNALGLINPALIVWEKVPYSFVVDWFLPVGSWISALDADLGYSFKGGSGTSLRKGRGYIESTTVNDKPGGWSGYQSGVSEVSSRTFAFTRKRYTTSPVPGLYFKSPISAKHIANSLSLLVTAFQ